MCLATAALGSHTAARMFRDPPNSRTRGRVLGRAFRVHASSLSSGGKPAKSVPLLFLDLDGVLNRTATASQINLEQDKVDRLRDVLETSGADVVLSTYWRAFEEYIAYTFGRMGAQGDRVVGRTPGAPHLLDSVAHDDAVKTTRIVEIQTYMEGRFGGDRSGWPVFAIVDDKQVVPEGHEWQNRFVQTTHDVGLTEKQAANLLHALTRRSVEDSLEEVTV
jgi:hypothetical protein|tara:strand:- start:1212 stop:1871 length:660 start_codon:yes stop_codon:yes gene_type:complete